MNSVLDEKCPTLSSIKPFLKELGASNQHVTEARPANFKFTPEQTARLDELRLEREQLLLAIKTSEQLKDPQQNAKELVSTLSELGSSPTECEIETMIRTEWYDAAHRSALEKLGLYLEEYKWPNNDLPSLDPKKPKSDPSLAQALEYAITLDTNAVFEVLARPIGDRIVYHFTKSTDTAQNDKPEWLFTYLFKVLELRTPYLTHEVQRLVSAPVDRLVKALTPAVSHCCRIYLKNENFMLHCLDYASALEQEFWVSKETADLVISKLVGGQAVVERFIQEQSSLYLDQLSEILNEPLEIDFDANVPSAKPTFSALHVKQMLSEADKLIRLDPYLVLTQCHLQVLKLYREQLEQSKTEFDLLCCQYGSAAYFQSYLNRWKVQLIVANSQVRGVERCTTEFHELRDAIAKRIAKHLMRSAQKNLKPFFRIDWRDCDNSSVEIRQFLDALRDDVSLVERVAGSSASDKARVTVPFAEELAKLIYTLVVQAHVFSVQSSKLLLGDIERIWSQWNLPLAKHYNRLIEAVNVLISGNIETEHLSKEEVEGLVSRRK